jgi:hypothetical protein
MKERMKQKKKYHQEIFSRKRREKMGKKIK